MEVDAEYFLFRSIVQHANDLITVFDELGRIVFMNEASATLLGAPPAHFVGLSVVDFVHPDERERAILTLQVGREFGAAPGTTHFRIRRSDGSYLPLELTTGRASDGTREYLTVVGRPSETREGLERAMMQLVDGSSMTDIMITVCDTVSWRQLKSRVGIVWQTSDGTTQRVTQGGTLPDVLCGIGAGTDSLFALAQARDERVQSADLSRLPDDLRRLAESLHMGGFWIEPVRVGSESALIVVWTVAGGHPPTVHVQGMQLARSIVEVILRWTTQQQRLDRAANHDELTQLPNRTPFFRALERGSHGAILYCDLDDFKPVNDHYGHASGDDVLRQVAQRLRSCVRETDIVARIGGDEFAILCPNSTAAEAEGLVARVYVAFEEPFVITDAQVRVGISIGVSHTMDQLSEATVAEADRQLREEKARRRTTRANQPTPRFA